MSKTAATVTVGGSVVWRGLKMRGTVLAIYTDTMTADVQDTQGVTWTLCVEDLRPAP